MKKENLTMRTREEILKPETVSLSDAVIRKEEHRRSFCTLKGAVLITVLTIMLIVMILAISALSIVMTLDNRTNTKYCQNQAYFAARSALNSTLACIQNYTGEDDEYVALARQVVELAGRSTGDYFTATTSIERVNDAGVGVSSPVELRFENIDSASHLIKLTSTATYTEFGNSSIAVVFTVGEQKPSEMFSNALTTLGAASGVKVIAYGGAALNLMRNSNDMIILSNDGEVIGQTIINGSAETATQTIYTMKNGESFICMIDDGSDFTQKADLNINNPTVFKGMSGGSGENPYVYISGNLNIASNAVFGGSDYYNESSYSEETVDVHCNTLTGSNSLNINGDLYIHGDYSEVSEMINSFYFTSIDITGNLYFDDPSAGSVFQLMLFEKMEDSGLPVNIGGDVISAPVSETPSGYRAEDIAEKATNPYKAMRSFQDVDGDGNPLFNGNVPVHKPVKKAPSNSAALDDYWDASQNAYIINTGVDDLINIDLSLNPGWGGTKYIERPVVVNGTGMVNLFVPSGATVQMNSSCILTQELYEKYSPGNFSSLVFESGNGSIKSPNINMYMEAGSEVIESNNSVISAYIYGPEARFTAFGVSCSSLTYNSVDVGSVQGVSVIGAMICGETFYGSNALTAIYVPQAAGGDDASKLADGSNISFKYFTNY